MDTIQAVIRKLNLNAAGISSVPNSFSSEVYKIHLADGSRVYVKIPFNKDKLIREYRILLKLSGLLPVPRVLDFWDGDDRITGALLLSEMEGVPCTGAIGDRLSFQIGVQHAKLHQISTDGYGVEGALGFEPLEQGDWRLYIKSSFNRFQASCKDILRAELFERCVQHFEDRFTELQEPDGPCMVHMDFRPGNILVDGDEVTGIIDFESSRSGASEIDFTKLNRYVWQVHPPSKAAYMEGYSSVRPLIDLDLVLPFYDFYDAFSAVAWCHKRGLEKHKAFLKENIAVLERSVGT